MKTNNKAFIELFLIMCLCCQFLCYHVVISGDGCIEIERNALLSFKEDFDDNYSGIFSSWKVGADDCCKWKGVECHVKTGRVISLNLRDQGVEIRGKLNSSLVNLKDLRYLDLSQNDFKSMSIPSFIGSFERLRYLNLSYSSFGGEVPSQLGNLSNLVYLDLHSSFYDYYLEGKDLSWISGLSYLEYLDLSYMNISLDSNHWLETINTTLPYLEELHLSGSSLTVESLGNLCSLRELILSHNYDIGGDIGELMDGFSTCNTSRLEILDLRMCEISGFLPNSLGYLSNLKHLDLGGNHFVGDIPKSIGNLTSLEYFSVWDNQLNGPIPESLGKLSSLSALALDVSYYPWNYSNSAIIITERHLYNLSSLTKLQIRGSRHTNNLVFDVSPDWVPPFKLEILFIESCGLGPDFPAWLRNQYKLKSLYLRNAMLSGAIQDWIPNLSLSLDVLDLSSNRFEGPLPQFSSNISVLDLSDNMFSGTIPHNIDQLMPKLESYSVSNNHLYGSIPSSIGNLSSLYDLQLDNNSLVGEIPSSMGNLSSLVILNLSMNHLTGRIPDQIGSLNMLGALDLSFNRLSGRLPPSLAYLTFLSHLNLSYNDFEGRIPTGNQFQTFDPSIYMNNPGLCGTPLALECSDDVNNRKKTDPIIIVDEDKKDELRWFLVNMVFGFAVGFWGFVGTLVMKQSWRRAYFRFVEDKHEAVMISVIRFRIKLMKPNRN